MKKYLLSLTENVSNQVVTDLDCFGVKILWVSEYVPFVLEVETNKSKEELESFFLIDGIDEVK
jgi:hypothetical protein